MFDPTIRVSTSGAIVETRMGDGLRVSASISRNSASMPNTATVAVYGLSDETREKIKPNVGATIEAGYRDELGITQIFAGVIQSVSTARVSSGVVTTLELSEGLIAWRDKKISRSWGAGATYGEIVRSIAADMGLSVLDMPSAMGNRYPRSFAAWGRSRAAMDRICEEARVTWSIQYGAVQILPKGRGTGKMMHVLTSENAQSPVFRKRSSADKYSASQGLVTAKEADEAGEPIGRLTHAELSVTTLLMPDINIGDAVKIDMAYTAGPYSVEAISHSIDTHSGSPWTTALSLVAAKEA